MGGKIKSKRDAEKKKSRGDACEYSQRNEKTEKKQDEAGGGRSTESLQTLKQKKRWDARGK